MKKYDNVFFCDDCNNDYCGHKRCAVEKLSGQKIGRLVIYDIRKIQYNLSEKYTDSDGKEWNIVSRKQIKNRDGLNIILSDGDTRQRLRVLDGSEILFRKSIKVNKDLQ